MERPFNSWDLVKLIALALMFIDHTGHFFYTGEQWLRVIGRGAAPVFLFLAGFAASWRFRRDILVMAVALAAFTFWIKGGWHPLNILFNIIACRLLFDWMERKGRHIRRPWEWYVGALALILSSLLVQYGTLGLLFAIAGYMKRRGTDYYPLRRQRHFLLATFVAYGAYFTAFSQYSPPETALLALVLGGIYILLSRLDVRPLDTEGVPSWLAASGKWIARHSLYIYALHLIVLMAITGIPA